MGGEKMASSARTPTPTGSPPHGRGKATLPMTNTALVRITPAWAGKSGSCTYAVHPQRDHPRMGGEKLMFIARTASRLGSPPHGRGKVYDSVAKCYCYRITPAWAGKRFRFIAFLLLLWDHPRMGGEKQARKAQGRLRLGSPPHGRGKASFRCYVTGGARITPAWAGKSGSPPPPLGKVQDHPRMGGAKTKKIP